MKSPFYFDLEAHNAGRHRIDENTIGEGTKIWAFASVHEGARIGERCTIGEAVHIGPRVVVGNGCKIQNGAQLFEGVTLEDDVFIGPHVVFTNVLTPRAFVNRREAFKPTLIKEGASVGANATILCGTVIGEYAMIGAGTVVTKNVPPHAIIVGNPGEQRGWACSCGTVHIGDGLCVCGTRLVGTRNTFWPQDIYSVKVADAKIP